MLQAELEGLKSEEPDFKAYIQKLRDRRAAFTARVAESVRKTGGFVMQAHRVPNLYVSITKSTRRGVAWQVTFWTGNPEEVGSVPTGHLDVSTLEEAAKETQGYSEPERR